MIFFFLGFLINAQYLFFENESLLNSVKEQQVSLNFIIYEDLYTRASITKNLFSDYFTNFSYKKNLEADQYFLNLSFLKGFNENNLRGVFLVNYTYLYFYEKNMFLLLSMQTGKTFINFGFDFLTSYYNSLDGVLSDRLIFSIIPFYLINKNSKIALDLSYYIVTSNIEYENDFEKTKILLKVNYSLTLNSFTYDFFIGNSFNNYYDETSTLKNNTLLFGIKSTYDI